MESYVLNGTAGDYKIFGDDAPLNGTSDVKPMNSTSSVMPMQGTSDVMPMQGTSAVVPMQGANGNFYVSPLSLIDPDDVPLNGMPDDYNDEDIEHFRLAYMVGDDDALNGLFSRVKEKRRRAKSGNQAATQGRRERRQERRDARSERRKDRAEMRDIRKEKAKSGGSFLDRFGGALSNAAEGFKLRQEAAANLEDAGIDFNEDVLDDRAAMAADAGYRSEDLPPATTGTGLMGWWGRRSTLEKVGIGVGAAALGYGVYKLATGKKRKRG